MDSNINIEIGKVYQQIITGTVFKYKVLKYQGSFHDHNYWLVENVETKFQHTINESELDKILYKELFLE
jgi:hypothetical protein